MSLAVIPSGGGLVNIFAGSAVQPSQTSYLALTLSANTVTYWPPYVTGTQTPLPNLFDVTPSAGGLSITLPDATLASDGQDFLIYNLGAFTFTLLNASGGTVATVAPGQQKYLYLVDNTSIGGSWRVTLFGVGASAPDASALAGSGLKAIGSTLNQSSVTATISASQTLGTGDRSKTYVNNGGAITLTLPLSTTVGNDYFVELRNQGSGVVTISPSGGELVDGSASITLLVNESCFLQSGVGAWYTIGRGRNQQFNFTQLSKPVTGGTVTLTLTEASNVVQTYTGALVSNCTVVLPAVVQVYYISNQTSGAFSLIFQSPTPGTTLSIPTGQNAVVFCDGTNVINASTSVGGISSLLLNAGSVSSPSLALAATNNGLFAPSSISLAVTTNGSEVIRWLAGQSLSVSGTAGAPSYSFVTYPGTGMYNPGANQLGWATASAARMSLDASGNLTPAVDNTQAFGSAILRWANAYATTFNGNLVGNVTGNLTGNVSGSVGTATNLSGTVQWSIPYQSASGITSYAANGTTGQVLVATTGAAPSWANAAPKATNLDGTTQWSIPYQSASGVTSYLSSSTAGLLMTAGGAGAPSWGSALPTTATISGFAVGYKEVPQNSQSAVYTTVLSDSGKQIYHPSADVTARTFTIDSNANVAYPIGTALTFINDVSAGIVTIAITADTMVWAGNSGATGSRTLAAGGMATAVKMTSTRWMISGSGLT
jgi:hypothetical protein